MATGSAERFLELDSLRAIAAVGVIFWHYRYNFNAAPFDHVLAPFYSRGLLMVDFFFVLFVVLMLRQYIAKILLNLINFDLFQQKI